MTPALSEYLPLIASAPDGIQKLRGLILELAVRGKLLPQEPSDEPATKLLERIEQEQKFLTKSGAYKKTKSIPQPATEVQPFDLPKSWAWTNFANVTSYIQRGKGPSYADKSDYVVVSQKCVRWNGLDLSQARCITPESFSKYDAIRLLRCGDVLWNSTGTGTIGRAVIVQNLSEDQLLVADSHVTVVRPIIISPDYLWRWIQTPTVQNTIESMASGSTNQIELATSTVTAHPIPIPPLAEQHRIVAKVDELMALCDRLESEQNDSATAHEQLVETLLGTLTQSTDAADFETNWKRIAEYFDTLFTTEASIDALQRTILQLAVMGRLLPLDSIDEQRNWKDGIFSDFFSLEYGDNLPAPKRSGTGEYPVYGSNGVVGTHDECRVTSPCIVVGRKGSAGALNCCRELGCWVTDVAYYCVPPESVDLDFAFILFQTLGLDTLGKGIKPGLSRSEAYLIPVAIPEITEQHLIVAKVNELMALCDSLKNQLAESRQQESRLADTLIQTSLKAA